MAPPYDSNDNARRKPSTFGWLDAFTQPKTSDAPRERRPKDGLLGDPGSDLLIDFGSQEGMYQAAKKKKAQKQQQPPPPPPPPAKPPADDGNNGKKDGGDATGNGDSANGSGGSGDGGDGNNGGGDPNDGWGDFATATTKKGKKNSTAGLPEIPTSDFGADAFHEIKLGDDSGKRDVNFGTTDKGSSWGGGGGGSKWGTGASGWDFSSTGAGNDLTVASADTKNADDNPWSINRGKPKKPEDSSKPEMEDPWGFGKKGAAKKKSPWGEETLDPLAESQDLATTGGDGDVWGWGNKKGKGAIPEPAPDPPAAAAEDDWFGSTAKSKKTKAGMFGEPVAESEASSGDKKNADIWDTWGISKKDRMKKKNIHDEFGGSTTEPAPPAASAAPQDDLWGGWSSKKKSTGVFGETSLSPEPDSGKKEDDLWGYGSKPSTKKKDSLWGDSEPIPAAPDPPTLDGKTDVDDFWSSFGAPKPKKQSDTHSTSPPKTTTIFGV